MERGDIIAYRGQRLPHIRLMVVENPDCDQWYFKAVDTNLEHTEDNVKYLSRAYKLYRNTFILAPGYMEKRNVVKVVGKVVL